MEESIKKFLEFNGKSIYFLAVDGQYWVALKPICEALGVDWVAQYKAIKRSKILGVVLSNQTIPDSRGHAQMMACLPEKYVYGWIFKLQSSASFFEDFQMKCYELLYDYFHGVLAKRISTLTAKSADREELAELQKELAESETGKRIAELRKRITGHGRDLRELDVELSTNQMSIFN
jgi:hypothetical protein